jgi:hypothetical protein
MSAIPAITMDPAVDMCRNAPILSGARCRSTVTSPWDVLATGIAWVSAVREHLDKSLARSAPTPSRIFSTSLAKGRVSRSRSPSGPNFTKGCNGSSIT